MGYLCLYIYICMYNTNSCGISIYGFFSFFSIQAGFGRFNTSFTFRTYASSGNLHLNDEFKYLFKLGLKLV